MECFAQSCSETAEGFAYAAGAAGLEESFRLSQIKNTVTNRANTTNFFIPLEQQRASQKGSGDRSNFRLSDESASLPFHISRRKDNE